MKKFIEENSKGITLVSLVVTIIVIMILTGITINTVLGKNGIVTIMRETEANQTLAQEQGQAKLEELKGEEKYTKDGVKYIADEGAPTINEFKQTGKNQYSITVKVDVTENKSGIATIKYKIGEGEWQADVTNPVATTYTFTGLEEATIYEVSVEVTDEEGHKSVATINPQTSSISLSDAKKDDMLSKKTNTPILIDEDRITIPSGYKIAEDTADSIDYGIIIEDKSGNEWVWVPVEDANVMCDTTNETEYTLSGTTGGTAVKTKLYSKSGIISGKTRTTPGTTSDYREPDLVTDYDTKEEYYKTILGYASAAKMAEAFVKDYEEMIKSVSTYGGFYIGRYELSEEGVQKDKATLTETNWYNLYKKCKELNASEKVETRMIWGCQWDVTMNWLVDSGAKTSEEVFTDSSTWGNYSNYNTANSYTEGTTGYEAGAGEIQKTGSSENWKANNIYDLAGNCWEWTQEANYTYNRAVRGGSFYNDGSGYPASNRDNFNPSYDDNSLVRVSSHFNNKVALSARA